MEQQVYNKNNWQKESSSNHEKKFYFFIERVVFPVMLMAVTLVTIFDIYCYSEYHSFSAHEDPKFLYLFPIPYVAPIIFGVNLVMSVVTGIKFLYWNEVEECWNKLRVGWNDRGCCDNLKKSWSILQKHCVKLSKTKKGETELLKKDNPRYNGIPKNGEKNEECKEECKQESNKRQKTIRFLTLVLLFGIVYLFYHGFWIIIALLAYPGRILLGGIFIVPLILVVIPMWNTVIKIIENCFDARNKSSCCNGCYTCIHSCCLYIIIYFCFYITYPCTRCYYNYKDRKKKEGEDDEGKQKSRWKGCAWCVVLFYELAFWGLFITILFYISRFLLGSIKTQDLEQTFKLVISYIVIGAASGIPAWLNTDLVTIGQENNEEKKISKTKIRIKMINRVVKRSKTNNSRIMMRLKKHLCRTTVNT